MVIILEKKRETLNIFYYLLKVYFTSEDALLSLRASAEITHACKIK